MKYALKYPFFASYHWQLFIAKEFQIPGSLQGMLFSLVSFTGFQENASRRQQRLVATAAAPLCTVVSYWLHSSVITEARWHCSLIQPNLISTINLSLPTFQILTSQRQRVFTFRFLLLAAAGSLSFSHSILMLHLHTGVTPRLNSRSSPAHWAHLWPMC